MQHTSSQLRPGYPVHLTEAVKPPLVTPAPVAEGGAGAVKAGGAGGVGGGAGRGAEAIAVEVRAVSGEGAVTAGEAGEPPLYPDEVIALAQLTAIVKMLSGCSLGASAGAAGVTRQTLYKWIHRDAKFQAAYNAWQLDALTSVRTKLLAMGDSAVNTLGRAVRHDPKIALAVLKAIGTLTPATPGSTDPEEVEQRMELKRSEEQQILGEKMFWASLGSGAVDPAAALREIKRQREEKEKKGEAEKGAASVPKG